MLTKLHHDERGTMSIVSVFALVLLTFLLGMVVNTARQIDHKVKMQNAADSATYAGGIVITRSMNTLAFTNHLLSEVFALTAFMREARDRNAESLTPPILDNWERVAPAFIGSEFPPFDELGQAIQERLQPERDMVLTYSDWAAAASSTMLPVLEEILADELIPKFQRALTDATPGLTQLATDEIARRHGAAWPRRAEVHGCLWRTIVDPVGGSSEGNWRTLPVIDPILDSLPDQAQRRSEARQQRDEYAHRYLRMWNDVEMRPFDRFGQLSQFGNLWRIFTCGYLNQLLNDEYPESNFPFQIRTKGGDIADTTQHLEQDFSFIGVAYRRRMNDRIPRLFRNPTAFDTETYAQLMMFIPGSTQGSGGWHLFNQSWTCHLVPATSRSIPPILSTQPSVNSLPVYSLPDLSSVNDADLSWISHH